MSSLKHTIEVFIITIMQSFINRIRSASLWTRILLAALLALILAVGLYFVPPIHDRLAWRVEAVRNQVYYFFNPPDEAVFQPSEQTMLATIVASTMQAYQPQPTSTRVPASRTPDASAPTLPPTATATPLPEFVQLEGVKYEHQHGHNNYCGPANFSMALTFWGWSGSREVIGKAVMPGNTTSEGKPANKDKNVMPYELQDYISANVPGMTSIIRYGGDLDLVKRLVAAGFPVVVEKGIYEVDLNGKFSWMGHYAFVTGYDEAKEELIYQDTYQPPGAPRGNNRRIGYEEFVEGWRSFNYIFVAVYPYSREAEVLTLLGDYVDETWAARHALEVAEEETRTLKGIDQYFAWFNAGTSHVALFEHADAALAFDTAFQLYATLGRDDSVRPYRMMWYQTGPYKAYFFSGRYTDVVNLANVTLNETISAPLLEESLYWRGQAYYMIGDTQSAIADYRAALEIHPGWAPAVQALQDLGVAP